MLFISLFRESLNFLFCADSGLPVDKSRFAAFLLCSGLLIFPLAGKAESDLNIIPKPYKTAVNEGEFALNPDTNIYTEKQTEKLARLFAKELTGSPSAAENLRISSRKEGVFVDLNPAFGHLTKEGYHLSITPEKLALESAGKAGIFYGLQTLVQIAEPQKDGTGFVFPCAEISDKPRFKWRGMHLDVCRHFMPVEFVKKYIDLLALHKMNRFHWHLTEDQGWRIEIKKYPRLTEIGSKRKETVIGRNTDKYDGKPHGGFYPQKEIREVVEYAAERFVTVVPEIEMPGHSVAALAAYPEYSCAGGPFQVRTRWGVSKDVYCVGKDKTIRFLKDVLREVIELFPGEYVHIGGDECPKDRWKNCKDCQRKIKQKGLENEKQLQGWFISHINEFLKQNGRKLVGWDEILEGGLTKDAAVMFWRSWLGDEVVIDAAKAGNDLIMAPTSHTYFDYYQGPRKSEPLAIGGFIPLKKVYSFDPVPANMPENLTHHILGAQAQLWTEYIKTPKQAEYMAYPRGCALAEVCWTAPSNKDFKGFINRLKTHLKRLDQMSVNYRKLDEKLLSIEKEN
ncbi:Beta-hexosaminidase [Sedimentisphaera cyanobacteriorum]|uniref:beta-N-acetylhexosaminidase n=1 Tax=Sedimentisphaera cyanobacteriorum TaxID=1940790 RepID=A0A1Q2HQT6_9BACT|nr:beta-N-acetylhexosaminidase [Sedimentisphaera cyanobacteriorum]AQQ09750.1 Beta-hexosaminidase [Sedimentisphaera cyanobacteriorum]